MMVMVVITRKIEFLIMMMVMMVAKVTAGCWPSACNESPAPTMLPLRAERFIFKPAAPQPMRAALKGQGLKVRDAALSHSPPTSSPPTSGAGRG